MGNNRSGEFLSTMRELLRRQNPKMSEHDTKLSDHDHTLINLEPADRVAYALLELADTMGYWMGALTTAGTEDGSQPGCLEKIGMVLRDDVAPALQSIGSSISEGAQTVADAIPQPEE